MRHERPTVFRVGLARNRLVFAGIAAEIAILLALIMVPPLRHIFGLAPLAFAEWWILLLFAPAILILEETRKAVLRRLRRT
jgi:hypothetical protein